MSTVALPTSGLLSVKWSKYIPEDHFPSPKQIAFLALPYREALFGGACGGGKSDALLMGALQWADTPGYKALIIRRTVKESEQSGAILTRAKQWLNPFLSTKEVHYSKNTFFFPSGATLTFGYLEKANDENQYQGGDWLYIAYDELTHFLPHQYTYLFTRLRCGKDNEFTAGVIPQRVRGATNPGSIGHAWVKKRFQIQKDDDGEFRGHNPSRPFIQSKLEDNDHIPQKHLYELNLKEADPLEFERLRWGNWDASPEAIFKQDWFIPRWTKPKAQYYHLITGSSEVKVIHQSDLFLFTSTDTAGSEATGLEGRILKKTNDYEPSWSVYSLWGMTKDYDLLWLDVIRGQWTVPDFLNRIVAATRIWKPVLALTEDNGINLPVFQAMRAKGMNVRNITSVHDPVTRSISFQLRSEAGRVYLPVTANWLGNLEDELFIWSGKRSEICDQIQTAALAGDYVSQRALGSDMDPGLSQSPMSCRPVATGGLRSVQAGVQSGRRAATGISGAVPHHNDRPILRQPGQGSIGVARPARGGGGMFRPPAYTPR